MSRDNSPHVSGKPRGMNRRRLNAYSPCTNVPIPPEDDRIYLDTNVYNRLADALTTEQTRGLSAALVSQGIPAPLLSPVNVIEIVQTSDPLRREKLVDVVRHLCAPRLLVTPEELIVDFIAETVGAKLDRFRLRDLFCRSELQSVWQRVREDPDNAFVLPERGRLGLRFLKKLDRLLHAHLARGDDFVRLALDLRGLDLADAILETDALRSGITKNGRLKPQRFDHLLVHILWLLIARIVAVGATMFPAVFDDMWSEIGVDGLDARVEYTFQTLPRLQQEGPIVLLAAWLACCATRTFDQGDVLDGYQLMYLPYVHRYLTFDANVLAFARRWANPTTGKIKDAAVLVEAVSRC